MRPQVIRVCVPALLVGAAWACGEQLTIGDPPEAAASPDASTASDGSEPDGSPPGESDAGAPFPCAPGDLLCTDFEGATVEEGWKEIRLMNDASVALADGPSVSPAHAFLSTAAAPSSFATLAFDAFVSPFSYEIELAFHVDEGDDGAEARILTIATSGASTLRLELRKQTTSSYGLTLIRRVNSSTMNMALATVAGQTWVHCRLQVTLPGDAGFGGASLFIDGALAKATTVGPRTAVGPKLEVGVDKGSIPAGQMRVRFDNVRMRKLETD